MMMAMQKKRQQGTTMVWRSCRRGRGEVKFMVMLVTEARREAREIQVARRRSSRPCRPELLHLGFVDGEGDSDSSVTEQGEEEMKSMMKRVVMLLIGARKGEVKLTVKMMADERSWEGRRVSENGDDDMGDLDLLEPRK